MNPTAEQEEVVSISSGRHLVLAPPGSGKTEMLSRRIMRALESGVDPKRMLCATFTNRAAFEMRDRVAVSQSLMPGERPLPLPDVGNLHHFCHRFLLSVGKLHPGKHVLDEVEQLEFAKEVVDVLREELSSGTQSNLKSSHGVTVINALASTGVESTGSDLSSSGNMSSATKSPPLSPLRISYLSQLLESHFADCAEKGKSPYVDILSAVLVTHQARIGIPLRHRRPMPPSMFEFCRESIIYAVERVYTGLKRKFRSVDFDDLVNEAYLWLEKNPLEEESRYLWVQIDEVQDLNPMQWTIVKRLTSEKAVSVYFGDVEQAIFSFLGASSANFFEMTDDCEKHYFRTNFRATPLLLEILMRYSLDALASEWNFLPSPSSISTPTAVLSPSPKVSCCRTLVVTESPARSQVFLERADTPVSPVEHIRHLLASGIAENVAVLVRTNKAADAYESALSSLGYRYAKVSGLDLFAYAPMRDFMAFVSLFTGTVPMTSWTSLVRRFARGIYNKATARYFVRDMVASGWDPMSVFDDANPLTVFPRRRTRRVLWAWRHRSSLKSFRENLKPIYDAVLDSCGSEGVFRYLFSQFSTVAFAHPCRYSLRELLPGRQITDEMEADPLVYEQAVDYARSRIERFLRYTDHVYSRDDRPLARLLSDDWDKLGKLKEADLLVGDEKIVISTIHKAKGRQFDAVVIPEAKDVLSRPNSEDHFEPRRLLYVAMSRAKRHLSIFGVTGATSEITGMRDCFAKDYTSYYFRRKDPVQQHDLERDWLFHWERLAADYVRGDFIVGSVMAALKFGNAAIIRMAIKSCCNISDGDLRLTYLREAVSRCCKIILAPTKSSATMSLNQPNLFTAIPCSKLKECLDTAVDALRKCGYYDAETRSLVREASLRSTDYRVHRAALEYFVAVAKACLRPCEISTEPSPVAEIGDYLYSRFPSIRYTAAQALFDLGDLLWYGKISGSSRDFDYLASVPDSEHESSIRVILETEMSASYEKNLRTIFQCRALRG